MANTYLTKNIVDATTGGAEKNLLYLGVLG